MKKKKIIGIALMIVGVVAILIGFSARGKVANARENLQSTSGILGNNAVGKGIHDTLEGKIDSYDTPILLTFIGGGILVIIGARIFFRHRKRR
jgi:hypothetical protein